MLPWLGGNWGIIRLLITTRCSDSLNTQIILELSSKGVPFFKPLNICLEIMGLDRV